MSKKILIMLLLVVALASLAACGGGEEAATAGDASAGEDLYLGTTIGASNAPGCITCHSVEAADDPLQPSPVGPSHYGVADRAGNYVEGMSAEDYLRESIVEPDAHIVEGFSAGVMYQDYAQALTEQEIDNLVAYLLTLDGNG